MLALPLIAKLLAVSTTEGREKWLRAASGSGQPIFPLLSIMPYYYGREQRVDVMHAWRAIAIAYAESLYDESAIDLSNDLFEVRERLLADAEDLRATNAEDEGDLDIAIHHRQLETDYLRSAKSRRHSLGLSDYGQFDVGFQAGGPRREQYVCNELARLYNLIGEDEQEEKADKEAYNIIKDSQDLSNYSQARLHEARIADRKGKSLTAFQIIHKAIKHVFVEGSELAIRESGYTVALDGMIQLYKAGAYYAAKSGRLQLGIKLIDRAIAWDRKKHASDQEFRHLVDKAGLLVDHGNASQALQIVQELEELSSRPSATGDDIVVFHTTAAQVFRAIATSTHDRVLLDRAFEHDMLGIRYVRAKRGASALTTATRYFDVYQNAVETAWSLYRRDSSLDIAWMALTLAEQGSAQHLADLTATAQRALLTQLPEPERIWVDNDRNSTKLLNAMLAHANGDPDKESQVLKDYENNRRETADHFTELHRKYPRIMSLIDPSGANLGAQRFDPPSGTVVLRFFETRSHVLGWALASGKIYFYQVGSPDSVRILVSTFLSANNSPSENSRRQATTAMKRLYQILIAPAERALKMTPKRFVVVPSGALYQIPFEALVIGEQRRRPRFLIDQASVIYSPSLTVFEILQNGVHPARLSPPNLLAFADPDYGMISGQKATLQNQVLRRIGLKLHPLPSARTEVDHIASLFASDQSRRFVGPSATLANLRGSRLNSYDFVHFAVHGIVPRDIKAFAQPVIALGGSLDDDGFVHPRELVSLGLHSYLTVLSACSSGVGVLNHSEGNIAFSTILLSGGSDHVLASLWAVEDNTTSELMLSFYRRVLDGIDLAEALRLAKLELLDRSIMVSLRRGVAGSYPSAMANANMSQQRLQGDWPFLWSSFILFGANTPVTFEDPADRAPLGSERAPVKCDGPDGEREYLDHLLCNDGRKVSYRRVGNIGVGVHGNIVDKYKISCGTETSEIYMDMYFHGYIEKRTIANFTFNY